MKYLLLLVMLGIALCSLSAKAQFTVLGETEMNWPGIQCQIFWLKRLPPDRLVVGVRLRATAQAPSQTLIGYPVPIPPNATAEDIRTGKYHPLPFSLASSVMIDDITKQKYPVLPPISPPGREYFPGKTLASLIPGQALVLTIQFAVPPPPPPPPAGQPPLKQTVSFLFTNAKDFIKKIPVPIFSAPQ